MQLKHQKIDNLMQEDRITQILQLNDNLHNQLKMSNNNIGSLTQDCQELRYLLDQERKDRERIAREEKAHAEYLQKVIEELRDEVKKVREDAH